jgi:hypothetical protein
MAHLQHFILTNFNVILEHDRQDLTGRAVLTREWIDWRIELFETFCLPSIAGQINQDFRWLIRFGPDTPIRLAHCVDRWSRVANITPLWNSASARGVIGSALGRTEALLLTTRLDSDDALHREFVDTVQRSISDRPAEVLDPPLGYVLTYPEGQATLFRAELGPFLTLAERVVGMPGRTIRTVPHKRAAVLGPVRRFTEEPLWLQVIHGRNIRNYSRGEPCPAPSRAAFSLGADVPLV